jgi:LPS export ABC transporter protein LptC
MLIRLVGLILCFSVVACQGEPEGDSSQNDYPPREIEQGLVLHNATLEQSNAEGKTLWKLSTEKVVYSQDQKTAKLENINGNLFREGQLILQVRAKKGEIKKDGREIYLQEDILVKDPRNQAELRGHEVEWRPQEDILIVRQNISGNHAKLTASAQEGKYYLKEQRLELTGKIIAISKEPPLQMKTEHLYWNIPQQKIIGDHPLEMIRYQAKIITDKLSTDRAEVDLKTNTATINGNIEYKSLEPPLQVASDLIAWQYKERILQANQPIKLIQTEDNMNLTANQAKVYLAQKMAYLSRGVYGQAAKDEVQIYADDLVWNIDKQEVEANGNVYYQQINPEFNLRGLKAVGKLKEKNVIVSGDYKTKVVTEIYPQE